MLLVLTTAFDVATAFNVSTAFDVATAFNVSKSSSEQKSSPELPYFSNLWEWDIFDSPNNNKSSPNNSISQDVATSPADNYMVSVGLHPTTHFRKNGTAKTNQLFAAVINSYPQLNKRRRKKRDSSLSSVKSPATKSPATKSDVGVGSGDFTQPGSAESDTQEDLRETVLNK